MTLETINQDRYITSNEGEKILGVRRPLFFYYVEKGEIEKKEVDKGPNLYKYADVLKVKEKRDRKKRKLVTSVDWQKTSDLPAVLQLDYEVYKEDIVGDIGLYVSWAKKNPNITLISYERSNRGNILAYISLVPLPEQVILSILKEDRTELTIKPDEVESYKRKGGYTLLAESAVTHPDHPEQLNKVISAVLDFWIEQYPDRYIEKIYAQAESEQGDILIRKLFFSPLYYISDKAYVLDLRKPGASRLIRTFQEQLREKATQKR